MLRLGILLLAILHNATVTRGELQNTTVSGNFVFQTFTDEGYYPDQKAFCEGRGGWPAEPRNPQLNSDLVEIVDLSGSDIVGYFIGLVKQSGQWKWQTDGADNTFDNWKQGEGTGSDASETEQQARCNIYAIITDTGKWEDRWGTGISDRCGANKRRYACQYNNYCTSDPCKNSGKCTPVPGTSPYYRCDCAGTGYLGYTCEDDYCTRNPCKNGGTCSYTPATSPYYSCDCTGTEYKGDTCEDTKALNEFIYVAIKDNKVWYPDANASCANMGGWLAEPRDENINEALATIMVQGDPLYFIGLRYYNDQWRWKDGSNVTYAPWFKTTEPDDPTSAGVTVMCVAMDASEKWWSVFCELHKGLGAPRKYICQMINRCTTNTCKNGGWCTPTPTTSPYYSCDCTGTGYTGDTCGDNYCTSTPCKNNGGCTPTPEHSPYYTCDCSGTGYEGNTCEINYCASTPCKNNGKCTPTPENSPYYTCDCSGTGYKGNTCEVNYCASTPCKNNGGCTPTPENSPYYTCDCSETGYKGNTCEVNYCASTPCKNNGGCTPTPENSPYYTCDCSETGYKGNTCEVNYCASTPCKNNGGCTPTSENSPYYTCDCSETGYKGNTCEDNYCTSTPCKNSGSCTATTTIAPYYVCSCIGGYYGSNCQKFLSINTNPVVIAVEDYSIDLIANITSTGSNATVTLYKNGRQIQNKTNVRTGTTKFTLANVKETNKGDYTIMASSTSESYTKNATTFMTVHVEARIESLTPEFIFSPITSGPGNVTCNVYGKPKPAYGWFKDGNPVGNATGSVGVHQVYNTESNKVYLNVEIAQLSDDGIYTCQATNEVGTDGREVTANRTTELAVYGSPMIETSSATPCTNDGAITIKWRPNGQTEAAKHRAFISKGNTLQLVSELNIIYTDNKTFHITSLKPNTDYGILIKVCPDECIDKLNTSVTTKTGDGTPDSVTKLNVSEANKTCTVSWNAPSNARGKIIRYRIEWNSTLRHQASGSPSAPENENKTVSPSVGLLQNVLETKPNREYKATVYAETCAGSGVKQQAEAACITSYEPPPVLPTPTLEQTSDRKSTRQITIDPVDEANGPVSCVFVVAQKGNGWEGKSFTPDDLRTLEENALSGDKSGYIALAIPSKDIQSEENKVLLGDKKESSCDASSVEQGGRRKRNTDSSTFQAINIELDYNGDTYSFVILTTTPSGNEFLLQQSPLQTFEQGKSIAWIIGVAVAAVLVVLVSAILVTVFIIRRRKRTNKYSSNSIPMQDTRNGQEQNGEKADHNIPLQRLETIYKEKKANEMMIFREEYAGLKRAAKRTAPPCTFGKMDEMKKKNRFINIIPYDSTRVHLQGEGVDSYINACHVEGGKKMFIASQGPLPHTVVDFWRMIVEQRCRCIVMLTRCVEGGKKKCEKYWPSANQAVQHGAYNIRNDQEKHFGGYVKRELKIVTPSNNEFYVDQYQFLRWPDHGVPKTTSTFFRLHREVMKNHEMMNIDVPIVVHCSAGVGRTGTFIGYDILLEESKNGRNVNIYDCVMNMRKQRVDMVQTCDQYVFLHKLLMEIQIFGETDITEREISKRFHDAGILKKELQNLENAESLSQTNTAEDVTDQQDDENRVVILKQPDDTGWARYGAYYVEAYHHSIKLVTACGPTKSTVEYFWRALFDNDIDTVVMLNSVAQGDEFKYWPESTEEELNLNSLTVRMVTVEKTRGIVQRTFVLERQSTNETKEVTHYQCFDWPEGAAPEDPCKLTDIVTDIQEREETISAILIHSSKGLGRAGAFCALLNLAERLKNEEKLDVFRAVKDLRDFRPGMIKNMEQYKFCYEALITYLSTRNVYDNPAVEDEIQSPIYENL